MFINFKQKMNWIGFGLMGIWLLLIVFATASATSAVAAKPPTKTPTPSGGPTNTPGPTATPAPGASYYVDCSAATNGNGTQASPWNNLTTVNNFTLTPGSSLLFKRGTTCVGEARPKGSGVSGNPITLAAYGTGARPIINGNGTTNSVFQLYEQQYWVIQDLEVMGGQAGGFEITGSVGGSALNYFRLINVYSHNHGINAPEDAFLIGYYKLQSLNDVILDNVTADNAFRGIEVMGDCCNNPSIRTNNVIVRNSTVHHVQNDGILIASTNNGLAENNVAYETGLQPAKENHTPNGIWNWDCDNCTFQFNESYFAHSPEMDGGGFDIDYFSHNSLYQYNYGHDNDTYCISIFGGDGQDTTTNNTVRYNVCANDGREATLGDDRHGELNMTVWSRGNVRDSYIYNNTFYWNPVTTTHSAIRILNIWNGNTIVNTNIYNNIFYSAVPSFMKVVDYSTQTHLNNNLYWYTGAGSPTWTWETTTYSGFAAYKTGTGQDAQGLYADPKLNSPTYHGIGFPTTQFTLQAGSPAINAGANLVALGLVPSMGTRDFFGTSIPLGGAYDIGADEAQ